MEVRSNTSIIHKLLFGKGLQYDYSKSNEKKGFLIHSSIIPVFVEYMKHAFLVDNPMEIWPYRLQIGETEFDMRLVFITICSQWRRRFQVYWRYSQYSFVWDAVLREKYTLFTDLDRFHELKEFIDILNLGKQIVSIEEQEGFNTKNKRIKIVTFGLHSMFEYIDLCDQFNIFIVLKYQSLVQEMYHYYLTKALPWLQPSRLNHFDKVFYNLNSNWCDLQIFLTIIWELSYEEEPLLNIIDLASLKLAFCDVRNESDGNVQLSISIDDLIIRELKRLARTNDYMQEDNFDIVQYAVDRKCDPFLHELCYYIQYTFQDYFKSIKLPLGSIKIQNSKNFKRTEIRNTSPFETSTPISLSLNEPISLVENLDVLEKVRKKSRSLVAVDGTDFPAMHLKLFCGLLETGNVLSIFLDTDYRWLNFTESTHKFDVLNNEAVIHLSGNNQFQFIEDFIVSLKGMLNKENLILVLIKPNLQNYLIFKNLNIPDIHIQNVKITTSILRQLNECNLPNKRMFSFEECTIEDDAETWELLYELNCNANLIEEETTWQYFFEFISNHLIISKEDKFEFANNMFITIHKSREIKLCLSLFKFTVEEWSSRVVIRDILSNRMVDLFELKNPKFRLQQKEDKSCFEFYQ